MKAVLTAVVGDLRRRKLQGSVIFIVILLSSLAATLALSLLVESDGPYDHAFAAANGAHLSLLFDSDRVSPAALASTTSVPGVLATAGPFPVTSSTASIPVGSTGSSSKDASSNAPAMLGFSMQLAGRTDWNTSVDRLTIESGHWLQSAGDIVLSREMADRLRVNAGETLQVNGASGAVSMNVVGIAASISPDSPDAWVLPSQIDALASSPGAIEQEMLYRVSPSATSQDLRTASQAIVGKLPPAAVINSANYLDAKRHADQTSAIMIPFLVAFSVLGLVISVLIIANVVSGSVISGYREIGILKALGMTPAQVIKVMVLQIVLAAFTGCLFGVPLGALASMPFLRNTAHALDLPAPNTATIPIGLAVFGAILAVVTFTAVVVGWSAAHANAVEALARGAAPSPRGTRISSWLGRLPLPRAFGLGVSETFASPLRSSMTSCAILLGVATVIFALGLHLSLARIFEDLNRGNAVPVSVNLPQVDSPGGGASNAAPSKVIKNGGPPHAPTTPAQVTGMINSIRSNPETARITVETSTDVTVPGIAEPISYFAYQGDSSWIGYALISGRWFSSPGEVVAPSALMDQAHLKIGDHFNAVMNGTSVPLTLVGEILDQDDNDLLLRGDWATAAAVIPDIQPDTIEIGLRSGVDPEVYAAELRQSLPELRVNVADRATSNTTYILFNSVIAGLAIVLAIIAVAGVFNTVVLSTRERARDIAILKAVGMAPRQVVLMVVGSVVLLGVIGGGLAIPIGLLFHHQILTVMGQVASGTRIPPSGYDVFAPYILPLLALTGVALAALGAFIPARWAASGPTAHVLQAE
ncbi:MAG TPA: FtsX-like permease family protein [Nitrolancea sp.]|nr:FtsX-like permease family protein [Nitrolancea sp.]